MKYLIAFQYNNIQSMSTYMSLKVKYLLNLIIKN